MKSHGFIKVILPWLENKGNAKKQNFVIAQEEWGQEITCDCNEVL